MTKTADMLVIFDCDGVLVDSEPLSIAVLIDMLGRMGVEMDEEEACERFLGRSLSTVTGTLKNEFGLSVGRDFLDHMRLDLYDRFSRDLKAIAGVGEALDGLTGRRCVASSSQLERIRLSLGLTGLLDKLEPHIFSATMVQNGKPAPDLFLYAASQMQVRPQDCIVIEDSPAGVSAAKAAGMAVFAFTGGSHAKLPSFRERLAALQPDVMFDAMADLVHLVQKHVEHGGR
jgi:HAD superfamily hydrolase (TIGR01509 family)